MQGKSNTQGKRLCRGRCLLGVIFMLLVWIMAFPQETNAAVLGEDIREGDVISLEAGSWSENYAVLIPDTTNIGTEGTFLILDGHKERIKFNAYEMSNLWEGSDAQTWCTEYYRKLPKTVSSKIIGVKTTDTESGSEWLVVCNIDGTKSEKDKVFFLSGKEYMEHTAAADHSKGYNWLLRSPGMDCSGYEDYIAVASNGSIHNYSTYHDMFTRPAFNFRLPHDVCVKEQTEEDGTKIWKIDAEKMDHAQSEPKYSWSGDGTKCTATAKCSRCGDGVEEEGDVKSQVIKEATEEEEGLIRCTATFKNNAFVEQTKDFIVEKTEVTKPVDPENPSEPEKPIVKPGTEVQAGDYIYMGEENPSGYRGIPYWKVLEKEDGTVLLMSEYLWSGNGTVDTMPLAFNQKRADGNEWQKSLTRNWCSEFEKVVLANVEGLRILETTKSDERIQSPDNETILYAARKNILDRDRVFFLSAEEVLKYMPTKADRVAYTSDGKKLEKADSWWLRSPRYQSDACSGRVSSKGEMLKHFVDELSLARPAFRADLSKMQFSVQDKKNNHTVWAAEKAEMDHSYGTVKYEWSPDMSECRASAVCKKCNKKISETGKVTSEVTKEATEEAEGNIHFTATFKNEAFSKQEKDVPIAKLPVKPAAKPTVKPLKNGGKYTVAGASYKVVSAKAHTVALVKAKNVKSVSVPATVKISGKSCKIVQVKAKAFTGKKIRKVTVGKNVKKLDKYAFAKSKTTTVVLKTKALKKSSVKGCFKSSKVKTVQVKVGTKKQNKKMVKTYKKVFTKKNCGKKVKVK